MKIFKINIEQGRTGLKKIEIKFEKATDLILVGSLY